MKGPNTFFLVIAIAIMVGVWVFQRQLTNQVASVLDDQMVQVETIDTAELAAEAVSIETAGAGQLTLVKEAGQQTPSADVLALLNAGLFSRERRLRIDEVVRPADWLAADETLPTSDDLLELWVQVRARRLSDAHCARIVAGMVTTCRPVSETVKHVRGTESESEYFLVTSVLDFTHAIPLGTLPPTDTVQLGERRIRRDAPVTVSGDAVVPGIGAEGLPDLFELVDEACTAVVGAHGNCGPLYLDLHMDVGPDRSGELTARIRPKVQVGWLEPPTDVVGAGD
ncbi:MAG: hypothetical protein AAFR35_11690 [Pseudomonadota bacterium]